MDFVKSSMTLVSCFSSFVLGVTLGLTLIRIKKNRQRAKSQEDFNGMSD